MRFPQRLFVFICILLFLPQVSLAQQVQKMQDLSGLWTLRFNGVEANCQNEAENGPKEGEFVFEVLQQGDTLSATWTDGETTNIFTGKVSGSIVRATVYGFYLENCRVLTDITAEITGIGGLVGRYSGQELNCETCTWEGELTVTITK
ncbi:MAG: hypothetical protein ACE5KK_03470 [Candidatus Brocadiales bacterium]